MKATVNDTELFYTTMGQGRPFLTLHGGLGFDHTVYRPYLDPLADEVQLIYYDHRGHGRSGRTPLETITHENLARDAEALRQHLGLGDIVLYGHSYGGFLALEYAIRFGEHLAGLILADTASAVDYPDVIMANAQARGTPEILEVVGRLFFQNLIREDDEFRQSWNTILPLYFHDFDPAVAEAMDRGIVYYNGAAMHRSFAELLPAYNVTTLLAEIQAPTLILCGRHDWITPPAQAERLHAGIPNSQLIIFEESGHFPYIEEQDAFLQAIREWLGTLR